MKLNIDIENIEEVTTEDEKNINDLLYDIEQTLHKCEKTLDQIGQLHYPDNENELKSYDDEEIRIIHRQSNMGGATFFEYSGYEIPEQFDQLGESKFLHGDFNANIEYANLEQILKFVEQLPEFISEFNKYIKNLTLKVQKAVVHTA